MFRSYLKPRSNILLITQSRSTTRTTYVWKRPSQQQLPLVADHFRAHGTRSISYTNLYFSKGSRIKQDGGGTDTPQPAVRTRSDKARQRVEDILHMQR